MKYFIFSLSLMLTSTASAHVSADSIRGRIIKQIETPAHFVSFDKKHSDRAYLRDESSRFLMNEIFTVPEMDCFLANHAKDDLQMTYQVREMNDSVGNPQRLNYLLRVVSLKTGDDTRTWAEKEIQDSELLARHHEQLKKVREE